MPELIHKSYSLKENGRWGLVGGNSACVSHFWPHSSSCHSPLLCVDPQVFCLIIVSLQVPTSNREAGFSQTHRCGHLGQSTLSFGGGWVGGEKIGGWVCPVHCRMVLEPHPWCPTPDTPPHQMPGGPLCPVVTTKMSPGRIATPMRRTESRWELAIWLREIKPGLCN